MKEFQKWLLNVVKHVIFNTIGQFFVLGSSIFALSNGDWKTLAGVAIGSFLTSVYNWANPNDSRFNSVDK